MARHIDLAAYTRDRMQSGAKLGDPLPLRLPAYQWLIAHRYMTAEEGAEASYQALSDELKPQFDAILRDGIKVEFGNTDPTPVNPNTGKISSKLFIEEVQQTGILKVFRSNNDHPYLDAEWWRGESMNSIFRAVHDWFGHCATGASFGWKGETQAYYSHASMFSEEARAALFCETVAQQCYYAVHNDYAPQRCVEFGNVWHAVPDTAS